MMSMKPREEKEIVDMQRNRQSFKISHLIP